MPGIDPPFRAWEEKSLKPLLAKNPERKKDFSTSSGVPVPAVACPREEDLAAEDVLRRLGFPGVFPFTRGIHPNLYRGKLWTMRQYSGFGDADDTNARYRSLLAKGGTGLSIAFDLPTQMGLDSDDPLAEGEVGKVGVAISSLEDMDRLFAGIPLDAVSVSMTINSTAAVLLAMLVALAERRGIDPALLSGTVQNDVLKEYFARGTFIFPPAPSLRLVVDVMRFCQERVPKWNSISVSGYHIREAGSTAVQEIAFTLADARAYVQVARERGLSPETLGERISFFFNAHNHLLEEVAKFRAARRLWASIMRDEFGVKNPRAQMLRFHTQTAGCTLTSLEPENNVVRVAYQALAAVFGGTQSLHTNSRDEALSLPSEESVTIALRTQQILGLETGVADTVDPLGGSYLVEAMTDRLEREARALLDEVERLGGPIRAVETGYFQRAIHRSAYDAQKRVEAGQDAVVGVNQFRPDGEKEVPFRTLRVDPGVGRRQAERLAALRARRDAAAWRRALDRLGAAARGDGDLLGPILDGVRALATVGEITACLREVFGTHREVKIF
ncbi:MAG: methylmalonyl-CoA mutase family protein [Planctomycetes bacterium]|jgi:methylmalonyl-CoA mutase N-terminal domain/subunit|nr:methylmalonyl-CoA mutase family protein [Planctomycetota bacterium]